MGNSETKDSMACHRKKLDTLLYLLTGSSMLFCSVSFLSWLSF